jgi:hypothetical protein
MELKQKKMQKYFKKFNIEGISEIKNEISKSFKTTEQLNSENEKNKILKKEKMEKKNNKIKAQKLKLKEKRLKKKETNKKIKK